MSKSEKAERPTWEKVFAVLLELGVPTDAAAAAAARALGEAPRFSVAAEFPARDLPSSTASGFYATARSDETKQGEVRGAPLGSEPETRIRQILLAHHVWESVPLAVYESLVLALASPSAGIGEPTK